MELPDRMPPALAKVVPYFMEGFMDELFSCLKYRVLKELDNPNKNKPAKKFHNNLRSQLKTGGIKWIK